MIRERLDVMLVERGLVNSRSRAQRLIEAGQVLVDGNVVTKASTKVSEANHVSVDKGDDYVSRGAYKLVGAFDEFGDADPALVDPTGLNCLDIGASTGGFTEVLLRRGAAHVIALDVGHGQLVSRIAQDPRVIEMSGTNIRDVEASDLPFRPQMIVSDVSFISLTYVIPVVARIAAPGAAIVLLVKPQFEVGRAGLDHNGIVKNDALRQDALHSIVACAQQNGLTVVGTADSPIEGTHGNSEYLLYARA
ncbi:cell division protein FtsJ [Bifidobacterium dolichotidis]|uniref:Cell division protein FtsJ n=1 Tax=Bifidobacterium dolichotidis TaxID=2306976 RepID=A0A430FTD1_9BIFI|nr:TlyA family RNA methyltransferase [Bifidobacterium dolichotidis]RSX56129.1 cell division protein FtsJ [Bifidobacterium dolichotidis]